jgi:hypothetical protein
MGPEENRQVAEHHGNGPRVGIFWLIAESGREVLITDSVPLSQGEPYGNCITHPRGHYEMWERWRRAGAFWLAHNGLPTAICQTEYEEHPRGRIVYERSADLFVIYADRRLQSARTINRIVEAFRLPAERFAVRSDDHYR